MTNLMKKYWFVSLVVLFLFGVVVYYVYDTNKDLIPGKSVNGKDVVYSINNINKTADEFYDNLYDKNGIAIIYSNIEKTVADLAVETTDEMKEFAKANVDGVIANFQNQYGENYQEQLLQILRQLGYSSVDDLDDYFIQMQKINQLHSDYISANLVETTKNYVINTKPRVVSHILVAMADSANPTAEELKKVKDVENELKNTNDFASVASKYSDDPGSASNGGSLGFVNSSTQFVPEFLEAMLSLNEGEVSNWVVTQFGYHLIKVDSTDLKAIEDNKDTLLKDQTFLTAIYESNPKLQYVVILKKAEELGIDFMGNDELKASILKELNIEEEVK